MPAGDAGEGCCDRCTRAPVTAGVTHRGASPATVARRRLLKAAVFSSRSDAAVGGRQSRYAVWPAVSQSGPDLAGAGFADSDHLYRAVSGTLLEVSPQVLVLSAGRGEQRFTLTHDAVAWRGAQLDPASLRAGDHTIFRLRPGTRNTVDKIWANIGRVTGIITERTGNRIVVNEGATRPAQVVKIVRRAIGRIQVRFPTLEAGYLVDIIGLRHDGHLDGMIPATSQPAYPATSIPAPTLASSHISDSISGSATWHEPGDEPESVLGVGYPALDPETGCVEDALSGHSYGYARMPYLAVGTLLRVRNECAKLSCVLPITSCAPVARLFNDRCVICGTSPRGRIADLTMASFVALGGELDRACFNATIAIGG